ncbi:MAG: enoyl-CoA hydratase/isomerase family protein [Desulfobacteraceae bacterium]|nr:enoyl-CoA hydratase/isomerase family protein [Desulfobacteraceae bacterium]
MYVSVKLDVIEGMARITLNRPKVFNALDLEAMQLLAERLLELSRDQRVIGIIIT